MIEIMKLIVRINGTQRCLWMNGMISTNYINTHTPLAYALLSTFCTTIKCLNNLYWHITGKRSNSHNSWCLSFLSTKYRFKQRLRKKLLSVNFIFELKMSMIILHNWARIWCWLWLRKMTEIFQRYSRR